MAHWTVDPLQLLPIALLATAYAMRVRTLRRRGRPPPRWRVALFGLGIALLVVAIASPIAYYGEERSFAFHMAQHVLLGDLAPLALLAGVDGPILRPLLFVVHPLRHLFHPVGALAAWAVLLYVWHLPVLFFLGKHTQLAPPVALLVAVGATIALAALTWHFVERPLLERWSRKPRAGAAVPREAAAS